MVLPGAQLFPHVPLPLYIFEPRYRRMLSWSLEQDRMFCIASMKPGISEAHSRDEFYHTVGLGLVRACVGREDGTSHLILQGMARMRIVAEKEQAEARLRESHERLEAMLYEVNHRVANSLQLVSSFVYMQARAVEGADAKAALEDTQRRIAAIAQVHRRLYSGDRVDRVDMAGYLASLLTDLEETWSTPEAPRPIILSAEPVTLDTDKAVAVGVIVNELVANACKYAYPPDRPGEVRVAIERDGGEVVLRVEDDGRGMPGDGSVKGTGIGSKLVNAMVANLKARIDHDPDHAGVRITISMPA